MRIGGDVAQQIRRVLRMRPGDEFALLDGLGYEYRVTLAEYGKDEVWAELQDRSPVKSEPEHKVTMCLALLNKPEKFEWALQKCTELGAARFVPVVAERSVRGALKGVRRERWERIIQEAAEQSGRGLIPTLAEPLSLRDALDAEGSSRQAPYLAIMPELGGSATLKDVLVGVRSISLFIGPEGGFTPSEVGMAGEAGVAIVTLGPRTLRAETAAVATLALVMHELGEM